MDALIELIFRKAEAKRFGTQFMTGPVLAGLVEAYVQVRGGGMGEKVQARRRCMGGLPLLQLHKVPV